MFDKCVWGNCSRLNILFLQLPTDHCHWPSGQQGLHLSLVPPPAIAPSPTHANYFLPEPACAIAPALPFAPVLPPAPTKYLYPPLFKYKTYTLHMYLQPILRWKLQGDTLALQFFSPLRESFPQKLKHFVTCLATTMETTGDSRWQKLTVVLTETTLSFVTKKEAAPSMTKHLPDVWKDKDAHFSQGPGPEYWAQLWILAMSKMYWPL